MVSQDEWELSKENLQPLKQGREPLQLAEASPAPTPEKSIIDMQKRQFWAEIESYSGPDPLDPWIRFVKWTQKTFVAGGHQAELLPLLERCTREMLEMHGYDDDIRYLRLWLQYADCLPQPQDVFAFLMDNEIGQNHALFYMAYSAFMELRGNFGKAEAIFEMGLNRMAAPIHKLRAKYTDFQERMERRKLREAQEGCNPFASQPEPQRAVLGVLKGKTKSSRSTGSTRQAQALGVVPARRQAAAPANDKENSSAALDVFTDDRFKDGAEASRPDYNLAGRGRTGGWERLPGFDATRKENERLASRGKGSKLKSSKHLMPALDPALDIPEDEDLKDAQQQPAVAKGTLRQRLDSSESRPLEESLMKDPLKLIKKGEQGMSGASVPEKPQPSRASAVHDLRTFGAGRTGPLFASKPPIAPDSRHITGRLDREALETGRLPEITLNTQAAFDSVNDMFKGALPKDFAWQANEPTTTIRFGDATVTMSTKAAYDAINSMFGASSIQETRPKGRPGSAKLEDRDNQTGMFEVYEDTGLLDRALPSRTGHTADQNSSFQPYEDTDFLPKKARSQSAVAEQPDSFSVYQDTDFLHGGLPGVPGNAAQGAFEPSGSKKSSLKAASVNRSEDTGAFYVFEDPDL